MLVGRFAHRKNAVHKMIHRLKEMDSCKNSKPSKYRLYGGDTGGVHDLMRKNLNYIFYKLLKVQN